MKRSRKDTGEVIISNIMVGISTSYFAAKGFSIYESVKCAHQLGFKVVEFGANHNCEENIFKTLKKIKKDFPKINFSLHGYFPPIHKTPTYINVAEGLVTKNKDLVLAMIEAAKILKAKLISFHSGFNQKYKFAGPYQDFQGFKEFIPVKKIASDKALQNQKEFFGFAVDKAKKQGITVLIEIVYSRFMGELTLKKEKDYFVFLKELPSLGFLLDYGHAFIEFKNPDQFFKLEREIKEIHLSDVKKKIDHFVLGTGEIRLKSLFAKIKKLSPIPLIILEHAAGVNEEEILKEKKLLEEFLNR